MAGKTVKEYSEEVNKLIKDSNGKLPGLKLGKDLNVKVNISNLNGNPLLVFSETNDDLTPTKILYCLELSDLNTVKALQIWLTEAMGILAHNILQESELKDIANV